jgi:amino acid adenylation domain-containing protein
MSVSLYMPRLHLTSAERDVPAPLSPAWVALTDATLFPNPFRVQSRDISYNEHLYLAGCRVDPPFCIHLVIEGYGHLTPEALEHAILCASQSCPGSRLALRRKGLSHRWVVADAPPPLRILRPEAWALTGSPLETGHGLFALPSLSAPFDPATDPTVEVLFLPTTPIRIVFRAFHGVMDARGLLFWAQEVFRALDGKPLLGATSTETDHQLTRRLRLRTRRPRVPMDCRAPFPLARNAASAFVTGHLRLPRPLPGLVAQLASAIGTLAHRHLGLAHMRLMVPTDLRARDPSLRSTGNLSMPLVFDLDTRTPWTSIQATMLDFIRDDVVFSQGRLDAIYKLLPRPLLTAILRRLSSRQISRNTFLATAMLSNLGQVPLDALSTRTFAAHRVTPLPFNNALTALSFVLVENPSHVELAVSAPAALISPDALSRWLSELSETLIPAPPPLAPFAPTSPALTVIDLFEAQVARTPEAIATSCDGATLTYAALEAAANQLAHDLHSRGIAEGHIVGLMMDRSPELIVSILAVLKLGAAYLPLEPKTPEHRRLFILRNANASALLVTSASAPSEGPPQILVALSPPLARPPSTRPRPDALAYVIYTSGSTGDPKGVQITHGNLANYLLWAKSTYLADRPAQPEAWPLFTSIAFDLTITALFLPLIAGHRIELFPGEPLVTIPRIVAHPNLTMVKATPSVLRLFLEFGLDKSRLSCFVVGGEDFSTDLAQKLVASRSEPIAIFNEYGPTEATVGCLSHRYDPASDLSGSLPIGLPCDNTRVFVVDRDGLARGELIPLPEGGLGVLQLEGTCLSRGYIDAALDAGRFITTAEGRVYNTGDLARFANGRWHYHGRIDSQVKRLGYRIELQEIEHAIRAFPGITDVIVTLSKPNEALIAYVICETSLPQESLLDFLATRLPTYMLPTVIHPMESFPLTLNGKVDSARLPALQAPEEPARGPSIETLRVIWHEVLRRPPPSDHDSFFALGGDSLATLSMLDRVLKAYDLRTPVSHTDLLTAWLPSPTLETLHTLLQRHGSPP